MSERYSESDRPCLKPISVASGYLSCIGMDDSAMHGSIRASGDR